jgi:dGTPase
MESHSQPSEPAEALYLTFAERERLILAPFALHSAQSRGRKYAETEHIYRSPFQRDRDRIVHSAAYRRLAYKTQVFTGELGDYHRTRLTHTLEVASVSRTIARALALNEDLVEALALLHDIGHPPFGHTGEDVLDECLRAEGGFSHNQQALRQVELLERRYPAFPGLNLSMEVLEGQAARVKKTAGPPSPLLEIQVVEAADSITYDTHDADDALELGLLTLDDLFTTRMWAETRQRVNRRWAALGQNELRRAVLRDLIEWQVGDVIENGINVLRKGNLKTFADAFSRPVIVAVRPDLAKQKGELEAFLFERVYRHPKVMAHRVEAQEKLREMFNVFCDHPERMPDRYFQRTREDGVPRGVADYLAGMTDRYALLTHSRL